MIFYFNIYIFIATIFLFLIILILIKIYLEKNKTVGTDKFCFGNFQELGNRDSQDDYFSVVQNGGYIFAVLADGEGNKKTGKYAAVAAVEILKYNFNKYYSGDNSLHVDEFYDMSYQSIRKKLSECLYNKAKVYLASVLIYDNFVNWSIVGDCKIYVYRKKNLIEIKAKQPLLQSGKFKIKKNDILLLCSKGMIKSVTEMEVLSIMSKTVHPNDKALFLSQKINKKAYKNQDNATAVISENIFNKGDIY